MKGVSLGKQSRCCRSAAALRPVELSEDSARNLFAVLTEITASLCSLCHLDFTVASYI